MKETLQKFFGFITEAVSKFEEGKNDEGLEKLKQATELSKTVLDTADKVENLEKNLEEKISKTAEEQVKKFVDMYLNAENATEFKKEIETLASKLDALAKEKKQDDEIVEKTLNELLAKTASYDEVLVSKQL